MKQFIYTFAIGCMCAAVAGCGKPEAPHEERAGIITMAPHLTETVFALGQGERVIGVGSFCDYPPETENLPRAGGYLDPDFEAIARLQPEMLIVPGRHPQVSEFAKLQHMPVLNIHMDNFETIDAGIAALGEALDCVGAADELRARIRKEREELRAAVSGFTRPQVFIVSMRQSHDLNTLNTVGRTSFVAELVELAGGDNIYGDTEQAYLEASKETVVARVPEVIVEFHCGEELTPEKEQAYKDDWAALSTIPAVRNGRIYFITESHGLRPGPRVVEVARHIAALLHPALTGAP